jgi:hypothetical protein
MKATSENRIWLFSFADLAFLLLIAFTQASTIGKVPVSIGEMTLPKVVEGPHVTPFPTTAQLYQVRIHKPSSETEGPFQLIAVDRNGGETVGLRIPADQLNEQLTLLAQNGAQRPVLIPDELSISKDMLLAMSLVEKIWAGTRTVTVEKMKTLE